MKGTAGNGINATNAASAKDLTITSTALSVAGAATVEGGLNGILAVNNGVGGSTLIDVKGKVVGATGSGVDVLNDVGTANLTIALNEVEGALDSVKAVNNGTGNTSITLTGNATGGVAGNGINATNAATAKDLTIISTALSVAGAPTVQGGLNGIFADNNGTGFTSVKATGPVNGSSGTLIRIDQPVMEIMGNHDGLD